MVNFDVIENTELSSLFSTADKLSCAIPITLLSLLLFLVLCVCHRQMLIFGGKIAEGINTAQRGTKI